MTFVRTAFWGIDLTYPLLLDCYRSGQISERQWQEHLKDEVFRQWLEKQSHTTPT